MTIKIGDQVLWRYSMPPLGRAFEVAAKTVHALVGPRLRLELKLVGDTPMVVYCSESECCAVPEEWEDAPDCPACRLGKWDGAVVDGEAMRVWYIQSMAWHRKHRLPIMVRMGWFELQEWPK